MFEMNLNRIKSLLSKSVNVNRMTGIINVLGFFRKRGIEFRARIEMCTQRDPEGIRVYIRLSCLHATRENIDSVGKTGGNGCAKPTRVKTGRLIFSSQTPHHHHRLMPLHLSNLMAQLTDSPRVTRFEIRNDHFPREEMRVWSRRRRLDSSEV